MTIVLPEAKTRGVQKIALVLDNGSTHASKQLPQWVKEQEICSNGKLTIQLYWLPTNASWLDQIEIWFSLLQRKVLQPNHFTSLHELETAILDFITHYNQTAKPLHWSYTVEQLEHKLAPRLEGVELRKLFNHCTKTERERRSQGLFRYELPVPIGGE